MHPHRFCDASIAQRRADALGLVAESALASALDPGSPGDRFQVTVHVEAETLCSREAASAAADTSAETREMDPVAPEPAASTPDSAADQALIEPAVDLHLAAAAHGDVLDVGRRTRTVPTALRRALEGRDRNQCQFPGCNSGHCDAHHVVHWADGGATQLANLVLCRFHHRAVHEEGFQVVVDGARQFQFLRPDGEPLPVVPPAPRWEGAGSPLAPTVVRLGAAGITIGPHTATPEWYGESLDLTAALDALWEPAATAARGGAP